ncbi:MAG: hypothetical protein ACK5LR_04445 [Mangrovibacterium sp.]
MRECQLENLFIAIFFNDVDRLCEIKQQYPKIYARKNDYPIDEYCKIDLTNLTLLNHRFWFSEGWSEKSMPLVERNRVCVNQLLDFWQAEGEGRILDRKLEYNSYYEYFYCNDPDDPESFEFAFWEPIDYYLKKGFREIDLRLYSRAQCFDFDEVETLLKNGANPNVCFEDEDDDICNRIYREISYLLSCRLMPEFNLFDKEGSDQESNYDERELFGDLLGLVAHEEMAALLNIHHKKGFPQEAFIK